MSNELTQKHIIGIGDYRVFNNQFHTAVSEVLKGVRSAMMESVDLQPRYDRDKAIENGLGFGDPEAYYHPKPINSFDEIKDAIVDRWEHMKDIYSYERHTKVLLEVFVDDQAIIDFCCHKVLSEIDFINERYPQRYEDIEVYHDVLEAERAKAVSDKCSKHKSEQEENATIAQLVEKDDMEGLVEIVGDSILRGRIGDNNYHGRAEVGWEDFRVYYKLSPKQMKAVRSSKGYHKRVSEACVERVNDVQERREKNYPEDPPFVPDDRFNMNLIKKAGAIGFVEPKYN